MFVKEQTGPASFQCGLSHAARFGRIGITRRLAVLTAMNWKASCQALGRARPDSRVSGKTDRSRGGCEAPKLRQKHCEQRTIANHRVSGLLKPYSLRADWADEMLKRVNEEKKQSVQAATQVIAEKRGEIEKINLRLQKLLDSFLDEIIDRET